MNNLESRNDRKVYSREEKEHYLSLCSRWNGSITSFCNQHNLNTSTFYRWRCELNSGSGNVAGDFIEVQPEDASVPLEVSESERVELRFSNGIWVSFPIECGAKHFEALCRALGGG